MPSILENEKGETTGVKAKIARWWAGQSSGRRMAMITMASVTGFAGGALLIGMDREAKEDATRDRRDSRTIVNEQGILEQTLTERVGAELASKDEEIEAMREEMASISSSISDLVAQMQDDREQAVASARQAAEELVAAGRPSAPPDTPTQTEERPSYPAPPIEGVRRPPPIELTGADLTVEPEILGGITAMPAGRIDLSEKKTEEQTGFYLAPGMMNATLLTGVDTLVSGSGTANPEPILARIQAPAILPNYVRANLQGCFVIGNATGSLAKERVEVQAVSLACVDFQERAVIEENIKGFFVDTDGKKGLSGKVVTKAGALVGRAFLAGMVEGFGEGVETAAGTQSVSALGQVRNYDTADIAQAGIGNGVAEGSRLLSDYYLELAKQTVPVIEVGAAKEVVLVIQEGVELKIRRGINVMP